MVKIEKVSLSTNSIHYSFDNYPNAINLCRSDLARSEEAETEASEEDLCSYNEQYLISTISGSS